MGVFGKGAFSKFSPRYGYLKVNIKRHPNPLPIKELKKKLDQADEDTALIKSQMEQLMISLKSGSNDQSEKEKSINNLKIDLANEKNQNQTLSNQVDRLEEEIKSLEEKMEIHTSEKEHFGNVLMEKESKIVEMVELLENAKKAEEKFSENFNSQKLEHEKVVEKVTATEMKFNQAEKELESYEMKLAESESKIQNLTSNIENIKTEASNKQTELQTTIESLRSDTKAKLSAAKSEHEIFTQLAEADLQAEKVLKEKALNDLDRVSVDLASKISMVEELQKCLVDFEDNQKRLEAELAQKAQQDAQQDDARKSSAILEQKEQEIEHLQNQLEKEKLEAMSRNNELAGLNENVKNLKIDLEQAKKELAAIPKTSPLKNKAKSTQTDQQDQGQEKILSECNNKITSLENNLQEALTEISNKNLKISEHEQEVNNLKQNFHNQLQEMENEVNKEIQHQTNKFENEKKVLIDEINNFNSNKSRSGEKEQKMKERYEEESANLEIIISKKEDAIETLEEKIKKLSENKQKEANEMKAEIEAANNSMKLLEKEIANKDSNLEELNEMLRSNEISIKELQSKLQDSASSENKNKVELNQKFELEILNLKDQMSAINDEKFNLKNLLEEKTLTIEKIKQEIQNNQKNFNNEKNNFSEKLEKLEKDLKKSQDRAIFCEDVARDLEGKVSRREIKIDQLTEKILQNNKAYQATCTKFKDRAKDFNLKYLEEQKENQKLQSNKVMMEKKLEKYYILVHGRAPTEEDIIEEVNRRKMEKAERLYEREKERQQDQEPEQEREQLREENIEPKSAPKSILKNRLETQELKETQNESAEQNTNDESLLTKSENNENSALKTQDFMDLELSEDEKKMMEKEEAEKENKNSQQISQGKGSQRMTRSQRRRMEEAGSEEKATPSDCKSQ